MDVEPATAAATLVLAAGIETSSAGYWAGYVPSQEAIGWVGRQPLWGGLGECRDIPVR